MSAENVFKEFLAKNSLTFEELEKITKTVQRAETKPELAQELPDCLKDFILNNPTEIKTLLKILQRKISETKKPEIKTDKLLEAEIKEKLLQILFNNSSYDLAKKIEILEHTKKFIQRYDPKTQTDVSEDRKPVIELLSTCSTKDLFVKILMKEESSLKNELNAPIEAAPEVYMFIEAFNLDVKSQNIITSVLSVYLADMNEKKLYYLIRPFDKAIKLTFEQMEGYQFEECFVSDVFESDTVDLVFDYDMYKEMRMKAIAEKEFITGKLDDLFEMLKSKKCVASNNHAFVKKLMNELRLTNILVKGENLDLNAVMLKLEKLT
jgi:hypothetical protein